MSQSQTHPQESGTESESDGPAINRDVTAGVDPTQLILPFVDAAPDIAPDRVPFKIRPRDLGIAMPTLSLFVLTFWFLIRGQWTVMIATALGTGVMIFLGMVGYVTSGWQVYPHERLFQVVTHARRRTALPWGYEEALEHADELHGIEAVHSPTAESPLDVAHLVGHDDRLVTALKFEGTNTEGLPAGELDRIAAQLSKGGDKHLAFNPGGSDVAPGIAYYSTTRAIETPQAEDYLDRAINYSRTRLTELEAGVLREIGGWIQEEDENAANADVAHYIIVTTTPDVVVAGDEGVKEALREDLADRVHRVEQAVSHVQNIDVEPVPARELLNLSIAYWTNDPELGTLDREEAREQGFPAPAGRDTSIPGRRRSRVASEFRRERDGVDPEHVDETLGSTPEERLLTPGHYDEDTHHVELDEIVARTFWISNWPVEPQSRFLHDVYHMDDVELDVKLHFHPRDEDETVSYLKRAIPRIDTEGQDRAEKMKASGITIEDDFDAYAGALAILETINTRPWGLSGYVTLRAENTDALDDAAEDLKAELKTAPANATPKCPGGAQQLLFRSAAPFGPDAYASQGERYGRADKTHLCLGGVIGAPFPPATTSVSHPEGLRFGWESFTGRPVCLDPFQTSGAPHIITIAPSGSGKTVSVGQSSQEWWLNDDDRTIIYCDTQAGFEDVVELFDADHAVIDGTDGINPFDIRPAPAWDREATQGKYNQLGRKIIEVVEYIKGLLRAIGVDPTNFGSVIEQAVQNTYANQGIVDDPSIRTHEPPVPADFFAVLDDMADHTMAYTFGMSPTEVNTKEQAAGLLLHHLSAFQDPGRYSHLMYEKGSGIDPDADIAYVDMRHLRGKTDADKSVELHQVLGQVSQLIKETEGETMFVIDEAHNLLHSPEMVDWLNKGAREWRRYNAALWFVTQSPQEFVQRAEGVSEGQENKRATILEQCSIKQIGRADDVNDGTLRALGIPNSLLRTVKRELIPGNAGEGFSEWVITSNDIRGWIPTRVQASPLHLHSLIYTVREHGGDYAAHLLRGMCDRFDIDPETLLREADIDPEEDGSEDETPGVEQPEPTPQPDEIYPTVQEPATDGGDRESDD